MDSAPVHCLASGSAQNEKFCARLGLMPVRSPPVQDAACDLDEENDMNGEARAFEPDDMTRLVAERLNVGDAAGGG